MSTPSSSYDRVVPLIVAVALFMENMDSTVIATSLPAIAKALGTNPLALKLAVTSYLLALAICIPASGWTADRFGARNVFRLAIGVFVLGSIGCALSRSLDEFVLARIVQGTGGAMMTPVGRLILVRSIDKRLLVNAMSLRDHTGADRPDLRSAAGRLHYHLCVVALDLHHQRADRSGRDGHGDALHPDLRGERPGPFDFVGFVLSGLGIGGLAFGLSVLGLEFSTDLDRCRAADRRRRVCNSRLHLLCQAQSQRRSSISVCSGFRHFAPAFSAASCSGSVSARCRFCCRCCCRSDSACRRFSPD